jgi:hypothetical protein
MALGEIKSLQVAEGIVVTAPSGAPLKIDRLELVEGAAPATPPSGSMYVYTKTDGLIYTKDDSGVEKTYHPTTVDINSITGTLNINKGGTGQTSKTAAFDALSPSTTKGDLIGYDGTDNVRVGVGINGQVLTADSTAASGVAWKEGGGGGSGGVNFIQTNSIEWNFEATSNGANPTGWTRYTNSAATPPTTFAAGSPNADWTFQGTTTTPLYGSVSGLLTKTANNRQGHGIASNAMTFTQGSLNDVNYISINYDFGSTSIASGDLVVYILDVTNSTLITPSVVNFPTAGKGVYRASFVTTSSTSYRLYIHQATTAATAFSLELDQIVVGPGQAAVVGGVIGPQTSYSPTLQGFGSASFDYATWQQFGPTMRVIARFTTGTASGVEARFGLPTGTTAFVPASSTTQCGTWWVNNSAGTTLKSGSLIAANGQTYVGFTNSDYTTSGAPATRQNDTFIGSSALVWVRFDISIAEWAGASVGIGQNDVEYVSNSSATDAADTTSFVYGPAGSVGVIGTTTLGATRTKRVRFQNPIQPTDQLTIEVLDSAGGWYPAATNRAGGLPYLIQNSIEYGIYFYTVNSTDVDVAFGQYARASGASFGAAGQNWSAVTAVTRWRLKKTASGIPVGFGQATATQSGLVSLSNSFLATTTQPGFTYRQYGVYNLSQAALTDATLTDVSGSTIVLPAGTYLIEYTAGCRVDWTVTPTSVEFEIYITDNSNNVLGSGTAAASGTAAPATATYHRGNISGRVEVTLASSTTCKMRAYIDVTGGTISSRDVSRGSWVARRIA